MRNRKQRKSYLLRFILHSPSHSLFHSLSVVSRFSFVFFEIHNRILYLWHLHNAQQA